jgi:hypothetical protein
MKFEDLPIGQHLWVLFQDKLVMVAKFDQYQYEVCGAWECGITPEECEIVELVNVPDKFKTNQLYYFKIVVVQICVINV